MEYHNSKFQISNFKFQIQLYAPAKINIGLLVKERLASGYHKIETIMVPIKLFDTLVVKRKDNGVFFKSDAKQLPIKSNLVVKAADLFFRESKIKGGADIFLEKKIPIGAGLGGGSSDAAQTLLGLNIIYGKPLSIDKLHKLATKIGMDVPFFLHTRSAVATNLGEKLKFINIPKLKIILYSPNFGISTKWAYAAIQNSKFKIQNLSQSAGLTDGDFSLKILIKKLINNDLPDINAFVVNSFESLVFSKYPALLAMKNKLLAYGVYSASLSGSGSSVFGLVDNRNIVKVKNRLNKDHIKAIFTESLNE